MKKKAQETAIFVHPQALNDSPNVGAGTKVWGFSHILQGARIGKDCNICEHVFVENDVTVGDRVTVKCGVQLWDGITLEEDVFVGPNVTFTNDPFPRSKKPPTHFSRTIVKKGASIGANATILPGITIGQHAMIGAGSVVTRDVPPHAVVFGNPARITSYTTSASQPKASEKKENQNMNETPINGIKVTHSPVVSDMRGSLTFAELGKGLPFIPKRYFIIYGVPTPEVRGEHAHKALHQLIICLNGSFHMSLDNGKERGHIKMDSPHQSVHVEPYVWVSLYSFSPDSVAMALASDIYKDSDYIRNYEEFLQLTQKHNKKKTQR